MKRLLGLVATLAGLSWGIRSGLAARGPESGTLEEWCTAAFVVMAGACSLYPVKGSSEENGDEETR